MTTRIAVADADDGACPFDGKMNGNQTWPDGLNYFTDNDPPVGQTFTTGINAMNLVSVAIKTAGLNSGNGYGTPASTPTYYLRISRAHWTFRLGIDEH